MTNIRKYFMHKSSKHKKKNTYKHYKADTPFETRDTRNGHVLNKQEESNLIQKLDYDRQFGSRNTRNNAVKTINRLHLRSELD